MIDGKQEEHIRSSTIDIIANAKKIDQDRKELWAPFLKGKIHETYVGKSSGVEVHKKIVGIGHQISRLWNMDAATGTFCCDFYINTIYQDPNVMSMEHISEGDSIDPDSGVLNFDACPVFRMLNDIDVEEKVISVYVIDRKKGLISYNKRFKGTFSECQELQGFPFDKQDFNIRFRLTNKYQIIPNWKEKSSWFGQAISNEWRIDRNTKEEMYGLVSESSRKTFPVYWISINAERISTYYVTNMIIPTLVLMVLSLFTLRSSPADLNDRLAILLGAFLTVAALKLVSADRLPQIGYLTVLDKFFLVCSLALGALGVTSLAAFEFVAMGNEEAAIKIDEYSMIAFFVFLFLFGVYVKCIVKSGNAAAAKEREMARIARVANVNKIQNAKIGKEEKMELALL